MNAPVSPQPASGVARVINEGRFFAKLTAIMVVIVLIVASVWI
ncbi:hypothetical protein [Vibrio nigripulchritudo]|nr:hypothetical protein [Vibrio nigripulchritudo]